MNIAADLSILTAINDKLERIIAEAGDDTVAPETTETGRHATKVSKTTPDTQTASTERKGPHSASAGEDTVLAEHTIETEHVTLHAETVRLPDGTVYSSLAMEPASGKLRQMVMRMDSDMWDLLSSVAVVHAHELEKTP